MNFRVVSRQISEREGPEGTITTTAVLELVHDSETLPVRMTLSFDAAPDQFNVGAQLSLEPA